MSNGASSVDAVVVGGGLGGLCSALALTRAGLSVRVLEKETTFGEVGAGLQVAPNGSRVLADWGLLDEVRSLGFQPDRILIKDALDGATLTSLDLSAVEQRYGSPYLVVKRSDLHNLLMRSCVDAGVDLNAGELCVGYDDLGDSARVEFATGRVEEAAIVVASDGLRSPARALISQDTPVNSGYVAYRGLVPIDRVADLGVDSHNLVLHVGPRCSLMQYPMRHGETLNQMAIFESPTAFDDEEEWGTPDELTAAFSRCTPQVRGALVHMWRDVWWPLFDREPLERLVAGRVVLTGDAAHPPLTYLAQGAVMAIEDAWVLGTLAAENGASGGASAVDWDTVLAQYDAVRSEHARRVIEVARLWGALWHHDERREWRNDAFRGRAHDDHSYFDWLFGPTALSRETLASTYPSG